MSGFELGELVKFLALQLCVIPKASCSLMVMLVEEQDRDVEVIPQNVLPDSHVL